MSTTPGPLSPLPQQPRDRLGTDQVTRPAPTPYRASYYLDATTLVDAPQYAAVVSEAVTAMLPHPDVRARLVMGLMEVQLEFVAHDDATAVRPFITAATALSHVTRVDTVSLQARAGRSWRAIDVLAVVRGNDVA